MACRLSEVPVVVAPRPAERGLLSDVAHGLRSLSRGMRITMGYLARPSTVVTEEYPENRETLKLHDRARSTLSLVHDENGFHRCTACTFCEQACPNASIRVFQRKRSATGKPELDHLVWRMETCTYCNACVTVCPFGCLTFKGSFESAVFDRRLLCYNLTRYAGPTSTVLMKVADPEERRRMIEPRAVFSGPGTIGEGEERR
jgi:NADH-quinone oxidoreductase subunit I